MTRGSFAGFHRPDGRVGVRNLVAVVPISATASPIARQLADDGPELVRATPHQLPLHPPEPAREQLERVLVGIARNPNVAGTLFVGLGTETTDIESLADGAARSDKPVETLTLHDAGGVEAALDRGEELLEPLVRTARESSRSPASMAELIVGLECGGSDATSGLASNPVVGRACDRLVEAGGTGVISETPEFIGAEDILADRCVDEDVRERLLAAVERRERMADLMGVDFRGAQPSPGNQEGGLTTIEEKSLGAIAKGGTTPLRDVIRYGDQLSVGGGFVVMDTPGYDVESVTGKAAGGAQIVVFTTGRGSTTGNPIAPVIKVTGNPETATRMTDNMDVDASSVIAGDAVEDVGDTLFETIRAVADGRPTAAERFGLSEFAINDIPTNEIAAMGAPR